MRIFLPLLWVLCAAPVRGIFDGTCPRRDPPPGVLVLSPGSKLVLTCSGHVEVDGVMVSWGRNGLNTKRKGSSTDAVPTTTANIRSSTGVSLNSDRHTGGNAVNEGYHSHPTEAGQNTSLGQTDAGYTVLPTTHTVRPTSVTRLQTGESEDMAGEDDYEEEEEGEEGSRVTRGIKSRPQWTWNRMTLGKGDRDWGEVTLERRGALLSLSSVRLIDTGRYTCYHRDRERFSLKVHVSDHPETPTLSCYKRSPSSKIRCEWTSQKPITVQTHCHLLLGKSPKQQFHHIPCSFSSRLSRCWCALDHNEDELRIVHIAYLCVTSITGNATSSPQSFTPLKILKPNPPAHLSVQQEEGHERKMTATWGLPVSWKSQDSYYALLYEIKYQPVHSLFDEPVPQICEIKHRRTHIITDALTGVEYRIQVRAREEYDGRWSEWSEPVYASSWTAVEGTVEYTDLTPTVFPEGSGTSVAYTSHVSEPVYTAVEVSHHVIPWICASFTLLLVILAAYLFRHKDRLMPKLQSLSLIARCSDPPQPATSAPTLPEGQALVTFVSRSYKKPPQSQVAEEEGENEEENEEEDNQRAKERTEAMHFSNISYFFLRRE